MPRGGCPFERGWWNQLPPTFPRLPGIIPVALSSGFSALRTATVLSRNEEDHENLWCESEDFLILKLFTTRW